MADAKKCDRCGGYYDKNRRFSSNGKYVGMIKTSIQNIPSNNVENFDVCDNCLTDFYNFMNLFKEKEND